MRKKISVDDLVVGMYLQGFEGPWTEHPFWRSNFVIGDAKQIALIRAGSIREVWIDSDKGLDAAPRVATPALPVAEVHTEIAARGAQERVPAPALSPTPVPIAAELARAAQICAQASQAVRSMFREARMGQTVDAAGVNQLVGDISASVARNASALISLARLKTADDYTYMHSVAVCAMMLALARQLGLDDACIQAAGEAGLLHDLGKALVPMELLNKPGKLTPDEFALVKRHPALGHQLLCDGVTAGPVALDVCMHHHEKIDGSGYPKGLENQQISMYAKMGAICDVYDAITSDRPYKAGWDPAESMRQMAQWTDGHLDAAIFQAFAKCVGIYPVGSLVGLSSGRIGVVIEQSTNSLTTPVVKVFFSSKSKLRIVPQNIDLSVRGCREKIVSREDPAKWNFRDLNQLWSGQAG